MLALALQRQQLTAAASVALDAELRTRGIRDDAVHEFEDQLRAKVEPEPEGILDEQDERDELPPPVELPDDWFDDDLDSSAAAGASSRPKGVTVCAFFFWLWGFSNTAWGAWFVFGGAAAASAWFLTSGALAIVLGISQFVTGSGLWRMKLWARKLGEALCWINVIWGSVIIATAAYVRLRGFAIDPTLVIWQFFGLLFQMLWALYLGRESTCKAFLAGRN